MHIGHAPETERGGIFTFIQGKIFDAGRQPLKIEDKLYLVVSFHLAAIGRRVRRREPAVGSHGRERACDHLPV